MTATRVRLDAELVRRGLARSREQAGELVAAGRVTVAGLRAAKAATQVSRDAPISIADTGEPGYVSRGGRKLAGALAVFGPAGLAVAGVAAVGAPTTRHAPRTAVVRRRGQGQGAELVAHPLDEAVGTAEQ